MIITELSLKIIINPGKVNQLSGTPEVLPGRIKNDPSQSPAFFPICEYHDQEL